MDSTGSPTFTLNNGSDLRLLVWLNVIALPVWLAAIWYVIHEQANISYDEDGWYRAASVIAGILPILLLALVVTALGSGQWTLDEQKVYYKPHLGRVNRIRWNDVRRIRWLREFALLQTDECKLRVNFKIISPKQARALRERFEGMLSKDFDLSVRKAVMPTRGELIQSMTRIAVAALPFCIVLVMLVYWFPQSMVTAVVLLLALLAPIPVGIAVLVRQAWRIPPPAHVPNRWRYRREKNADD